VLRGELVDGDGVAVTDGMIEVWQPVERLWGRCGTHPGGAFSFVISKPAARAGQAPHLELYVFPDEREANAADPVFAGLVEADRARLVADREDDGLRFDIHLQGARETIFFST
jgi:protocatechuate 3,4-dioxygenase alpha subunit